MTAEEFLAALDLPLAARVDRRVPKSVLMAHGAPTAADRREVAVAIEAITWVAALKPTTVGVPAFRDVTREYLEIALLRLSLRGEPKVSRLLELVHRAVPYPVVLVSDLGGRAQLSLAHKRWSQGESGRVVLDGGVVSAEVPIDTSPGTAADFLAAMNLSRQPQSSLFALYGSWIDVLLGLEVARRTGRFTAVSSPEHSTSRREALAEYNRLELEMRRLRAAAARERQVARQVDLNLELKRLEAARASALARL